MKEITTKKNDAWVLVVKENSTTTRYEIMTLAGKYRGGKIYSSDKTINVLSGKTTLIQEINWRDTKIILTKESGSYIIPAWIPHIFYFPETTEITEEFSLKTETQDFERYRAMKK